MNKNIVNKETNIIFLQRKIFFQKFYVICLKTFTIHLLQTIITF